MKKWKICLIVIASCFTIAFALGLYFHSGESFSLDFLEGEIKRFIPLKKGDELKFYFKVPEDGFSGLNFKLKSAKKEPIFSAQIILRKLYKQSIVIQEIVSSDDISKDGFLKLRFNSLIFSRGTEFELAINSQSSPLDTNLEFIVITPDKSIQSLPAIYNTSVIEGSPPLKLHFTRPLFIWRLLLNNAYILLILTTILSFLLFRALPERYRYHWAIFYFSVLLMLPTYVIISPDEEGFYNSLMGAILKTRALAEGNLPFWDSFHGIGMPYNTMSSINWHPIWLLLDKVPLSVVVSILYHLHVLIALYAMYGLARLIGLRNPTAFLCALSYICSTQGITYIFGKNFWPSGMIPMTLLPLVFLVLIKFLYANETKEKLLFSLLTASCFGFLVLNCHLGMVLIFAICVTFYLSANWRRLMEIWPWVLLLGCLILLIAAGRLMDLSEELRRFPSNENFVKHYVKLDFFGLFLWPLIKVKRGLAFGAPFFLLSLIGIFWTGLKSVHRTTFSVTIIGCYLLLMVPLHAFLPNNWGANRFIVLFSVLLAGLVAEQLWGNLKESKRWIITTICFLQAIIVLAGAGNYWERNARYAIDYIQNKKVAVLKMAFNTSPLTRAIEKFDNGQGGRSYFTRETEKTLIRELIFGYHFETLPLNGLRILNGRFNGIDYSDIHPNRAHMKAHIVGSKKILFNKSLLDVLGIKYIFADLYESVPSGLVRYALLPGKKGKTIAVYTNPAAWPDAVVVDEKARLLEPSSDKGDRDINLLNYDFRSLLELGNLKDGVTIRREHGSMSLFVKPSRKKRFVLVNEYFRPGWKAKSISPNGIAEMRTRPLFGHFIGIEIPTGVVEVRLSYRPSHKTIFLFISLGAMMASTFLAFVTGCTLLGKRKTGR
jgi:hypothetical protein